MSIIGKIVSEDMSETEQENGEPEENGESEENAEPKEKADDVNDTDSKEVETEKVNGNGTEKIEDDEITIMEDDETKEEKEENEKSVLNGENGEEDDIVCVGEKEADESKLDGDSKTISDEIFFENISQDEKDFYAEEGHDPADIEDMKITCTACWKQVNHHGKNNITRHPMLGVPICRACKNFYAGDEEWEKDEEGWDIYCRWCANGGDLICCDSCTNAFCKRCIQRNKGRSKVAEITSAEKWDCFNCRPSQIFDIRSLAFAIFKWKTTIQAIRLVKVKEEKDKKKNKRLSQGKLEKQKFLEEKKKLLEKIKESKMREKQKEKKLKAEAESKANEGMLNIRNFVDENIKEAFDTLGIYSKCLQDEKKRWMRVGKEMDANNAAVTVKRLRKIYSITKQNMDLLDTAIVQAYGDTFPEESEKKLKIGGIAQKTSPSPKSKTSTPKPKKNKTATNSGDCDVEEIIINGEPTFGLSDDEFDPSQLCSAELTTGESTDGADDGPKSSNKASTSPSKLYNLSNASTSKPRPALKVSTNMFKKKSPVKRMKPPKPKKKAPDSDIEEITIDDSDEDDNVGGQTSEAADTAYESQSISPAKTEPPPKKRRRSSDSDGSLELF